MATNLFGYGPNNLSANDDYDLKALNNTKGRRELVVVGLKFNNGYDGNVTVKSRTRGSAEAFVAQGYTKADETNSAAAIAAATNVKIDATDKDIRLTTAGRTAGDLDVTVGLESEI